ncbi:MAG: carboxypeptidase regulatory-like domain-containing protein [Bryobacteraceae bacterium]
MLLAALALPALPATVSGRVELRDSTDSAVVKSHNYSGVVVWLQPAISLPPTPGHARMVQSGKRFSPHILAVASGTRVDFPNFDPIFHNAFSNFDGKLFDIGLYPPGSTRSVKFDRPGVARVFCNIHPMMSAIIVVVDGPYFAISGKDGAFQIENVPPGDYQLRVFHERATQETLDKLARRTVVLAPETTLALIKISESGYLMMPHKNKFGREYPAATEDGLTYPGTRK